MRALHSPIHFLWTKKTIKTIRLWRLPLGWALNSPPHTTSVPGPIRREKRTSFHKTRAELINLLQASHLGLSTTGWQSRGRMVPDRSEVVDSLERAVKKHPRRKAFDPV